VEIALVNALNQLGVPAEAFVSFEGAPTARHLKYMDLLHTATRGSPDDREALPDGVVEVSGKAAVYVIRSQLLAGPKAVQELAQLTRTLACRADAAYLAVVEPGVTTVYRVGFYNDGVLPPVDAVIESANAVGLRNLLCGHDTNSRQAAVDRLWLDDLLFKLLTDSAADLQAACTPAQLPEGTVLSLIGRALFTRFLVDRDIVREADIGAISLGAQRPEQLFSSVDSLVETFTWLDHTFNGDLLDLGTRDYRALMAKLGPAAVSTCTILSNIMSRAAGGQLSLDWEGLRFQHIPVDVLSQVYEHFAHRFTPDTARETSIHFTPRGIAELLVDGVFNATPEDQRHSARVLDPAVGAGVFLVLAFRRLVAERWLHFGTRPKRAEVRRILTQQLCGMDINPTSIKVAALSLYLATLELDPEPQPLNELRFECLFDSTLRCVDREHLGNGQDAELGSLSTQLRTIGPFDIVLGNPPWTRLAGTFKKLLDQTPYLDGETPPPGAKSLVPNQWPDLAFLWRSTEWCKPGGVIGILVHARLLFSEEAATARARWFSMTRVTGVLNGMLLRKERKIWPSNSQPFCALVSINEPAGAQDSFYFLTPRNEPMLGQRREFRLDPRSAIPVPAVTAIHDLHAFKTLARGSALDLDLVARVRRKPRITMREYIEQHQLEMHQGFIAGVNNLIDASVLKGLPILEGPDKPLFTVTIGELDKIEERHPNLLLQWPRDSAIYAGPHLLFREAPKQNPAQRGAVYTDGDVAFSRSFYGITIPKHLESLAAYLYVLSYSDLIVYWTLMTSSKFGVERDIFNITDFGNFPLTPLANLTPKLQKDIGALAEKIRAGHQPWSEVNVLVAQIYGLTEYDQALVADALNYESPYPTTQSNGLRQVDRNGKMVDDFATELANIVSESEGCTLKGRNCELSKNDGGWQFVRISCQAQSPFDKDEALTLLQRVAEPLMSSEIRLQLGTQDWLIGRLRHERYWSRSQARLLALDLIERGLFSDSRE
jgi:hypothetical protein